MIILKIWGGLGNQMFIYALYKTLVIEGKDVKMDVSWFDLTNIHNGYELERIFKISFPIATHNEIKKLANNGIGFWNAISKLLFNSKYQKDFSGHKAITFYSEVFNYDDIYLQGYWQSEKYFLPIKELLRKRFLSGFENTNSPLKDTDLYKDFLSCECKVSLHVRRGDYIRKNKISVKKIVHQLLFGKTPELGGVCTEEYYSNAINYIESKTTKPHYFIFSDDIDWCKINLKLPEKRYTFVDINKKEDSYLDMYLMSQCNHNIIANSSFSWWGAWLNSHGDKIVIAPDRWFQDGYSGNIIPEDWITISTI